MKRWILPLAVQFLEKFHPARIFERRKALPGELDQLLRHLGTCLGWCSTQYAFGLMSEFSSGALTTAASITSG